MINLIYLHTITYIYYTFLAPVLTLDSQQLNLEKIWSGLILGVEHKTLLLENCDPKGHVLTLTVLACRGFLGGGCCHALMRVTEAMNVRQ